MLSSEWRSHSHKDASASDVLAPLSALALLDKMSLIDRGHFSHRWPALPDAQRLTNLTLGGVAVHLFTSPDAALWRLRTLRLSCRVTLFDETDVDDPLILRKAFHEGRWQPHRLTALDELFVDINDSQQMGSGSRDELLQYRVGAEWAPLALRG